MIKLNIKLRVLNLIARHRTRNPFKLARLLNIEIVYEDLGEVRGFFKKILRRKFIFINNKLSEFDQKLVCAHELGHAVLHFSNRIQFLIDNTKLLRKSRIEDEANLFASWLLFPSDDVIEEFEFRETETNFWMFEEIKRLRG
ncbi:ImmA/IrrE family metallo-endopeptidase [Fusobacterium polymorphum]|uniref:ImmA/IrrE family metallo-endopeptidase n=1 Tax=Fusobacterium nucleatum subsp. polymorphum TaxID=76857 RepID=UPI002068ADCC|nr:MAG TPA: IrrE protein [Caudoviricetes sp.]